MKRLVLIFGMVAIGFGLNSCKLDDDGVNFHFAPLEVVDVVLPESFQLNGRYQIIVTYNRPDDCTFFEGFDVVEKDVTVRNVVVVGSVITDRDCTEQAEEVQATFNFVVLYDQTYTFRFWQGEDENGDAKFLEVEVPVE